MACAVLIEVTSLLRDASKLLVNVVLRVPALVLWIVRPGLE